MLMARITSPRFNAFLASPDTFRVYKGKRLVFSSRKDRLAPMLEYIDTRSPYEPDVVVYDRITGNAAALLLLTIRCKSVYSALGSEAAINTLRAAGIRFRFNETVDCIKDRSGENLCPMEQLSLGKTPVEFYRALKKK